MAPRLLSLGLAATLTATAVGCGGIATVEKDPETVADPCPSSPEATGKMTAARQQIFDTLSIIGVVIENNAPPSPPYEYKDYNTVSDPPISGFNFNFSLQDGTECWDREKPPGTAMNFATIGCFSIHFPDSGTEVYTNRSVLFYPPGTWNPDDSSFFVPSYLTDKISTLTAVWSEGGAEDDSHLVYITEDEAFYEAKIHANPEQELVVCHDDGAALKDDTIKGIREAIAAAKIHYAEITGK